MFNFLIYLKFKFNKWRKLKPNKRLKYFQKMHNIFAKKYAMPAYKIVAFDFNDNITLGLCDDKKQTIFLNAKFFVCDNLQYFGLATLFHEQRHAWQNFIINSKKKFFVFSRAYRWKKNFENYKEYDPNNKNKYSYYSMQDVEIDANKFAIMSLKNLSFWFKDDEIYLKTLLKLVNEFENTKEFAKKELGPFYKLKLFLNKHKNKD